MSEFHVPGFADSLSWLSWTADGTVNEICSNCVFPAVTTFHSLKPFVNKLQLCFKSSECISIGSTFLSEVGCQSLLSVLQMEPNKIKCGYRVCSAAYL